MGLKLLICGTPGCGKTTLAKRIVEELNFIHLDIAEGIKQEQLFSEIDQKRECTVFNSDALYTFCEQFLEKTHENDSVVADFHSVYDLDVANWFDVVVVLRTDSKILYERLEQRGYPESKIQENVQAEIFRVVLDELLDQMETDEVDYEVVTPETFVRKDELLSIIEVQNDNMESIDSVIRLIQQMS